RTATRPPGLVETDLRRAGNADLPNGEIASRGRSSPLVVGQSERNHRTARTGLRSSGLFRSAGVLGEVRVSWTRHTRTGRAARRELQRKKPRRPTFVLPNVHQTH